MSMKLKDFRHPPRRDPRRCDGQCPTPWPLVDEEVCARCYERPTDLPCYGAITGSPRFWEGSRVPFVVAAVTRPASGNGKVAGQRSLFEPVASLIEGE